MKEHKFMWWVTLTVQHWLYLECLKTLQKCYPVVRHGFSLISSLQLAGMRINEGYDYHTCNCLQRWCICTSNLSPSELFSSLKCCSLQEIASKNWQQICMWCWLHLFLFKYYNWNQEQYEHAQLLYTMPPPKFKSFLNSLTFHEWRDFSHVRT